MFTRQSTSPCEVAKLGDGEDEADWFRRSPADLRRCLCAARVFPSAVGAVGAWQMRFDGFSAVLISVQVCEMAEAGVSVGA